MGGGVQAGVRTWVATPQEASEELLRADVLSPEEALLPCSLNAAMAGASGGALGAVFGFGAAAVSLLHLLWLWYLQSLEPGGCVCRRQGCKTQRPWAVAHRSLRGPDLCKGITVSWPLRHSPLATPA